MSAELNPPEERECVECGRRDVWDDEADNWVIASEDDALQAGDRYCIHVWDINGHHNPVSDFEP